MPFSTTYTSEQAHTCNHCDDACDGSILNTQKQAFCRRFTRWRPHQLGLVYGGFWFGYHSCFISGSPARSQSTARPYPLFQKIQHGCGCAFSNDLHPARLGLRHSVFEAKYRHFLPRGSCGTCLSLSQQSGKHETLFARKLNRERSNTTDLIS